MSSSKREVKQLRKLIDKDFKVNKAKDVTLLEKSQSDEVPNDFLSFNSVDVKKYESKAHPDQVNVGDMDIESRISKKYDRTQYPWLSDFTLNIKDAFLFLHNEIIDFVKFVSSSEEDIQIRKQVVKRVRQVIKEAYPDAQVLVFGSCATGLNLPNSDIDLLVYQPEIKEGTMINRLTSALIKSGLCKHIEPLKHAKVPIIKLQDKQSNINVDISFNRTNGVYCVKLMKILLKKYPELRPLLIVLKTFLKSRQLNESYHGGVSSFLLTMLTTSYLQRKYKEGGTDQIDLGKHLLDFFELYGTKFNYEDVAISIREEGFYFPKRIRGW